MGEGQRERGDVRGRPPTQWGSAQGVPVTSWQALARGLGAVGSLLNPVLAVTAVLLVVVGRALPTRVRAWIAGGGAVGVVVAVLVGSGRRYTRAVREVIEAGRRGGPDVAGSLGEVAAERWPAWLVGQLPFGITAGVMAGGLWLLWRSRYRASWREVEQRPVNKARRRLEKLSEQDDREPAKSLEDLTIRLGVDIHSAEPCTVPGRSLRQHVFVAGATGYGKSRSIEQLAYELIGSPHAASLRLPFLFADMKADPDLIAALHGTAHRAGRRFRLVTVTGHGDRYNPIRNGSAEQVRSRIVECLDQVAGGGFSEPHHREAAEEFLLYCVRALDDLVAQPQVTARFPDGVRQWRRDLPDLARIMTIKALSERLPQLTVQVRADVAQYLDYLTDEARELRRSIPGLATRVRNLISGDAGRILTEHVDGIDLYASIKAGDVVLFSLSAARDARAARQVGSLFLTDLGAVGDRLLEERWGTAGGFFLAGVDEFSGLGGSTMASLFQRVRGAGGGLVLCTQDMADLSEVGEAFAAAVMTNTNVMILHRQKASAADIAEQLGTRESWQETIQVQEDHGLLGSATAGSGFGSLRQVDKFKVHPNTLRELPQGQAVVTVGHPVDSVQTVRMLLAPRFPAPAPSVGVASAVVLNKQSARPVVAAPPPGVGGGRGSGKDAGASGRGTGAAAAPWNGRPGRIRGGDLWGPSTGSDDEGRG